MLANHLVQKVMSAIPDVILNGDPEQRYPGKNQTRIGKKHQKNTTVLT